MNPIEEAAVAVNEKYRSFKLGEDGGDELIPALDALRAAMAKPQPRAGLPTATGAARSQAVSAFGQYLRTGQAMAAMTISSGPDGGIEVPTEVDRDLQKVAANESAILRLCKRVVGATDGYAQNVSTNLPANAWIAESGARSVTATPTLAQVAFTRGGVYAVAQASAWFVQDAIHNVDAWLNEELGRSLGASIGAALAAGDGTNKPKGITTYVPVATADATRAFGTLQYVPSGTAGAVNLDACLTALMSLHPYYQENAAFVMSLSAALALRSQKASGSGDFMWNPDSAAGQPATLFGKPCLIDPNLPAVAANSLPVWVGDWKRGYTCVNYGQPVFVRDAITVPGQIRFYIEERVGGAVTDSSALKCVKASAS